MDKVSIAKRSEIMARVQSKDTKPEMIVRKIAFSLGFRYHINSKNLPGKPDLSIKSRKKAVFVHGCFWHRHEGCKMASTPVSNTEYWTKKFLGNQTRDRAIIEKYKEMGWRPLIIWECEIKDKTRLRKILRNYLK